MRLHPLWLGALVLAAAGVARGQEAEPDPFAEDLLRYRSYFDYGGFQPDLGSALPEGYVQKWTPRLSVSGTYTDNADQTADRSGAFWADAVAGLGWLRRSPRLEGTLDYRYSTPFYENGDPEGRDSATQVAAGGLRWRATEHLTLAASGSLAQNLEAAMVSSSPGERSSYDNRSDQYRARASGAWRPGPQTKATLDYDFSYRDYRSSEADGEDTLSHRAGLSAQFQPAARDAMKADFRYEYEDVLDDPEGRTNEKLGLLWTHALEGVAGPSRGSLLVSYDGEREDSDIETDWWSHDGRLGYRHEFSTRTTAGANAGYQWVLPDSGGTGGGWVAGFDAAHRFGERTRGYASASRSHQYLPKDDRTDAVWTLQAGMDHSFSEFTRGAVRLSHSYERRPAEADTEYTILTKTWRLLSSVTSRLTQAWRADAAASWELGDRGEEADFEANDGDYWQVTGNASLNGALGRRDFAGIRLEVTRRQTAQSGDDYLLARTRALYRRELLDWLSGELSYTHERWNYDTGSSEESYHENRGVATVTVAW